MSDPTNERERLRIQHSEVPLRSRNNPGPQIPRGIEVLLKKASVDPEFRRLLLEQRGRAAGSIELQLGPAETAMLETVPGKQLQQLITQTVVPDEQRRIFLGKVAAAMLALVGVSLAGCEMAESAGARPDRPEERTNTPPAPATRGTSPDRP